MPSAKGAPFIVSARIPATDPSVANQGSHCYFSLSLDGKYWWTQPATVNADGSIQLVQDLGYPPGLNPGAYTIHVHMNNGAGSGPDTILSFTDTVPPSDPYPTQALPGPVSGLSFSSGTRPTVAPTPSATPTPTPVTTPTSMGGPEPAVALPDGYVLAFDEEFNEGASFWNVDVANKTPIATYPKEPRYLTHTPYGGDFSGFSDASVAGWPFTADAKTLGHPASTYYNGQIVQDGVLDILGWKDNGGTHAGIISTADGKGNGFSCKNGYWEAKIWLPPNPPGSPAKAPGLWPAFWLNAICTIPNPNTRAGDEIDILEAYSVDYTLYHTNVHHWFNGQQSGNEPFATVGPFKDANGNKLDLSADWHVYSCLITATAITFYLDGKQVFSGPTDSDGSSNVALYGMVDFAFGGGWPISQNWGPLVPGNNPGGLFTNLLHMQVAYLRVWDIPSRQ